MRAFLVSLALSLPVGAAAQHVGLPVDSLAFAGTQRADVDVSDPHGWVQVTFRGERIVRVDVSVARNAEHARDALREVVRTTAGELPAIDFADQAYGDDGFVAFVRDNIAVVVRSEQARSDARVVDAAIRAAPLGAPDLSPLRVSVPQLEAGVSTPIQLPPDVLSAHVVAHGPATARNTRRGWIVTRTGPGDVHLESRVCDVLLRRR